MKRTDISSSGWFVAIWQGDLSLLKQRSDNQVLLMQLAFCHVNSGAWVAEFFTVLPVRKSGIIFIFVCDSTVVDFLVATIADIRGFIKSAAAFPLKIGAGLVAGRARSAFDTTNENLSTGIGLFAVIAMDAEVLCIVKSTFIVPVRQTMCLDFFRDGSRISLHKCLAIALKVQPLFREFSMHIRSSRVRCFWLPGIW